MYIYYIYTQYKNIYTIYIQYIHIYNIYVHIKKYKSVWP